MCIRDSTRDAGTFNSTIITRLRVPISKTKAIPTDIWKRASRIRRLSGKSGDATSENGSKRTHQGCCGVSGASCVKLVIRKMDREQVPGPLDTT